MGTQFADAAVSAGFHSVALLLVVAGGAKLRHAGVPDTGGVVPPMASAWASRLLGAAEVCLGCVALLLGGMLPAALLSAAYVGFTVVSALQRKRGHDCGCFGAASAPVTGVHVTVNVIAAATSASAAVASVPGAVALLADQPLWGLPVIAGLVVTAALLRLLLTSHADLTVMISNGGRA